MALIKHTPACPARFERPTRLREAARYAARMGLAYGASMGLAFTAISWLFPMARPWYLLVLLALKSGAFYGAWMFPFMLWLLRPGQYKLAVRGPEDAAAVVATLDEELRRLRFQLQAAQADFRQYRLVRLGASRLAVVDLLVFADEVVLLGPVETLKHVLKRARLRGRATRSP